MLHETLHFEVEILAGLDGPPLEEYNSETSNKKMSMEAVSGTMLCPKITIHHDFEWHRADGYVFSEP